MPRHVRQAEQSIEGEVIMVGYLAIGIFVGCLASGISLYFGTSFLVAFGIFFPVFGSIAVLTAAIAAYYAQPIIREKARGQS